MPSLGGGWVSLTKGGPRRYHGSGWGESPLTILRWATHCLFVLCLPILFTATSVSVAAGEIRLYEYGIQRYGAAQRTGLTEAELLEGVRAFIRYFYSSEELAEVRVLLRGQEVPLFNQREATHLRDVKGLLLGVQRAQETTLVYGVAYALAGLLWKRGAIGPTLAQGLLWGSAVTVTIIVALGVGILLDFEELFLQFHFISFANAFWMLDPSRDRLIMMFPEGFFRDATLLVAGGALAQAFLGIGAALTYLSRQSGR